MTTELKPKYVPHIPCPHCGKKFDVGQIRGSWANRTCPECGKSLLTKEYDKAAAAKIEQQQTHKAKELKEKDTAKRHTKIAELIQSPLLKPLCFLLEKNAARHMKVSDAARDLKVAATCDLDQIAMGRYYTSEWYLCSGTALKRVDGQLDSYELSARYGSGAKPYLKQISGSAAAGGIIGEWRVFDTLQTSMQESSALQNIRLVPNVYLPSSNSTIEGLADQTDLLVLTRSAAFVCEVKNWRSHIRVQRDQQNLVIKTYEDVENRKQDAHKSDKPVVQIKQRMADFAALGFYPKDCIYGIAVFVDPQSFENTVKGFFNKTAATSCISDGTSTLVSLIENEISSRDAILSQEELDTLAERMLDLLVDHEGKLEREQQKIRDNVYNTARQERLTALADFAVNRRQAGYERREEHGKKRDAVRENKKGNKSKNSKKQRYARKQRLYEIEQEYDEWDYLAC